MTDLAGWPRTVLAPGRARWRWLVLLVLALGWLAPGPTVQGNGIRVVSDRQEINFPESVEFFLEAAGEAEITEVRLNYRPGNSQVWAYSYPDFQPDTSVTARFSLATGGASYLPPGSWLEYSYLVRDARGGELETPVSRLEYVDTRFDWSQTRVGPLTLFHHDVGEDRTNSLGASLEPELQRVADLLQLEQVTPVRGYLYNSPRETQGAFPQQSRTITSEQVFHGFAFPANGVFVGIGQQPGLIVHETTHLLFDQALGPGARLAPAWLDEGFASYMEPESRPYSGQSFQQYSIPLRAMSTVSGRPQDIYIFYYKAESVVAYLLEEHGPASFQRFLGMLREGSGVDPALLAVYGFDTDGLDGRWAASGRGRPLQSPGGGIPGGRPSPLVYLDTWLLGGLVLLVVVLVSAQALWRRLRREQDPEEGLQPWEDPDRHPDNPWR